MNLVECIVESKSLSLKIEYKLNELDLKIIRFLKDEGYLEVLDKERNNFNENISYSELTESVSNLYKFNIIDNDYDAWHQTYVLTDLGNTLEIK